MCVCVCFFHAGAKGCTKEACSQNGCINCGDEFPEDFLYNFYFRSFADLRLLFLSINDDQAAVLKVVSSQPDSPANNPDDNEERRRFLREQRELSTAILQAIEKRAQQRTESPERNQVKMVPPISPSSRMFQRGNSIGSCAGDLCNETQLRLSKPSEFTGFQKYRELPNRNFNGQGDFSRCPDEHSRVMLALTNGPILTIPTRAADFRTEVCSLS